MRERGWKLDSETKDCTGNDDCPSDDVQPGDL